ncbi:class I SAM-dependent methyltransferase [Myxococcota bacterium]
MWDRRYREVGYAYGTCPNDFLVTAASQIPPGPVLSLGEGEGRNAVFLAERGHDVRALDSSAVGLDKARRLAAERHVPIHTVLADLGEYELGPSQWAGIIAIFCHLPPAIRKRVHHAVLEALLPGGVFVLEAYRIEQPLYGTGGPKDTELLYSLAALEADLTGLDFLHAAELVREVNEGTYHRGRGAVVQILARRPGLQRGVNPERR